MFIPNIPIWCWNLYGEDAIRLSQPTSYVSGSTLRFMPRTAACAARCEHEDSVTEVDGSVPSHPFLCGALAIRLQDGSYRCRLHSGDVALGCAWCAEYAARGEDRACPGCHLLWREQNRACDCCPDVSSDGRYDADADDDADADV